MFEYEFDSLFHGRLQMRNYNVGNGIGLRKGSMGPTPIENVKEPNNSKSPDKKKTCFCEIVVLCVLGR